MRKKIAFLFLIPLCAIGLVFAQDGGDNDANLRKAKEDAIKELDEYFKKDTKKADFTGAQKTELEDAKEKGKANINAATVKTQADDFTGAQKDVLEAAKEEGRKAIEAASSTVAVKTALANAKKAVDEVKLKTAKTDAIKKLDEYFRKDTKKADFTGAQGTALEAEKDKGRANINAAKTEAEVNTTLANATAAVNGVLTNTEAAELRKAQTNAIKELDEYFKVGTEATDFTGAQKIALEAKKEKGKKAINAVSSTDAVNTALANVKKAVDEVWTDTKAATMLQNAKDAAITELNAYFKAGTEAADFTGAQKTALEKARTTGEGAITAANDTVAVTVALIAAKLAINELISNAGGSLLKNPILALAVSCFSILAAIALFVLMTTKKKALITENERLREDISSLSTKFESASALKTRVESLSSSIEETKILVGRNNSQSQKANGEVQKQIKELNGEFQKQIEKLEGEIQDISRPPPPPPPPPPPDTVEMFNQWAANPSGDLPPRFYYLKNFMQMRSECELIKTSEPTKWIANKTAPLCLFPNPNFFTPHTDISEFYDMDITKLKPKGQNKIKITEPCEMTESGYVTYPGKLDLI